MGKEERYKKQCSGSQVANVRNDFPALDLKCLVVHGSW